MKRQPDGRFRGNRAKIQVNDKVLIGRWVETQVIRLKRMGVSSFETIADLLTRAGRGEFVATVSVPADVTFPTAYSISKMGAWKAYRRRLEREPSLEAEEHFRMDIERLEEMFLMLQPRIKKGDPKAIETAARIVMLKSRILGYHAPTKIAVSQVLKSEKGRDKQIAQADWDDDTTISMFQQAVALLNGLENKANDERDVGGAKSQ